VTHLVAVGEKLFVANRKGVHAGPGKWKEIATGEWITSIRPSEDRTALVISREPRGRRRVTFQIGRYELATGRTRYRNVKPGSDEWNSLNHPAGLLDYRPDERWSDTWVRIPTGLDGDWVVGPLGSQRHRVVETSHAVWIASRGELIRLDRARMAAWVQTRKPK
jgi:hypothetical protein